MRCENYRKASVENTESKADGLEGGGGGGMWSLHCCNHYFFLSSCYLPSELKKSATDKQTQQSNYATTFSSSKKVKPANSKSYHHIDHNNSDTHCTIAVVVGLPFFFLLSFNVPRKFLEEKKESSSGDTQRFANPQRYHYCTGSTNIYLHNRTG